MDVLTTATSSNDGGAGIGSVGFTSRAHVTIDSLFLGPWYFSILPFVCGVVVDVQDSNEVGGEKCSGTREERASSSFLLHLRTLCLLFRRTLLHEQRPKGGGRGELNIFENDECWKSSNRKSISRKTILRDLKFCHYYFTVQFISHFLPYGC